MLLYRYDPHTFRVYVNGQLRYWYEHEGRKCWRVSSWTHDPKWSRRAVLEFVLLTGEMP